MKHCKTKTTMLAACAAILFSTCNEEYAEDEQRHTPLQLITQTRATSVSNSWDGGEQVMVSLDNATAAPFTAAASGTLTPNSPVYWTSSTQTITARGWYPNSWIFPTDQSTATKMQAADFVFAPTVSIPYTNRATTPLVFDHRTAKVTVNLTNGTAISAADVAGASVSFYGYTASAVNTTTGAITGNTNGDITPVRTGNSCTALLIPQDMTAAQFIKVTVGGNDYYYRPASGEAVLQAGKSYTYNVTVNKTELTVTVVANGAAWGAGDTDEVTPTLTTIFIYTVADMQKIGVAPNWTLDQHYILMADLTLNDWVTIGISNNPFTGTFDGNGHTLNFTGNMTANGNGEIGLFGNIRYSTVKNLKVTGTITSSSDIMSVGAIAGSNSWGIIQNCVSTANITANNNSTLSYTVIYVGGITGYNTEGQIKNCYTTGAITAKNNDRYIVVGGIAGFIIDIYNSINVSNCYASGNITGTGCGGIYIGGIAGDGRVYNCVALNSTIIYTNTNTGTSTLAPEVGYVNGYGYDNNNDYGNSSMTINGSTLSGGGKNGTSISSTQWSSQTWWSGTATFSFGTTDDTPWVFVSGGARARPIKLYWEP